MTEAEWLACTDPGPMLEFLRGKATDRKLRLFGVACCRRIWHLLADDRSREAVEVIERLAEGQGTGERWYAVRQEADDAADSSHGGPALVAYDLADIGAFYAATVAASRAAGVTADAAGSDSAAVVENAAQVLLLYDIFGPPLFRPVTIDPAILAWNDRLVVRLARGIYDDRRWADMPILGDALLDAGCNDEEVLAHCRAGGEHVRGCWVVDTLLGKE